jgi:hypothetical protein
MEFNNWTIDSIKEHIDSGENPSIDSKQIILNHAYLSGYTMYGKS